jgi:hypothetical protein
LTVLRIGFKKFQPIQILNFNKEKEMPEFRKWIIASAAVALFAGLASAQVGPVTPGGAGTNGAQFSCGAQNGAVTPILRSEGFTELVGDIIVVCTGGAAPAPGTLIPTATITVFLNQTVTSRLLSTTTTASEALLLVNEPGSAVAGYGPTVPQTFCTGGTSGYTNDSVVGAGPGGCAEYVGTINGTVGVPVSLTAGSSAPGANVFQGVTSGNQVVFNGIPVMPPTTSGDSLVYRITNIRVNANNAVGGGGLPGSITASVSSGNSSALQISANGLTVGFVTPGLNASFVSPTGGSSSSGTTVSQCVSQAITSSSSAAGMLRFAENFSTAFKVRGTNAQNIPGSIFNAESDFTYGPSGTGLVSSNSSTGQAESAGYADYGTRLKAVFSNVPSGVTLYVTTRDVQNDYQALNATGYPSYQAVLLLSETASDSAGVNSLSVSNTSAGLPVASQTVTAPVSGIGLAPVALTLASGTGGYAVWEVVNTNPNQNDTINFGLYVAYAAATASNLPTAPSTFTVTLSYAPTPDTSPGFSASSGDVASSALTVPRFSDSLDVTKSVFNISLCSTAILFPYAVNVSGFDTGLAIANTSVDNLGSAGASSVAATTGTCSVWFYGTSVPTVNPFVTPPIAAGTDYANMVSVMAPGFDGYMIASCNFTFAHGFIFISDVAVRNFAMGYLGLIIVPSRATTESLNN